MPGMGFDSDSESDGLDTYVSESTSVYLRYDGEVGAGFDRHTLGLGLRIRW